MSSKKRNVKLRWYHYTWAAYTTAKLIFLYGIDGASIVAKEALADVRAENRREAWLKKLKEK